MLTGGKYFFFKIKDVRLTVFQQRKMQLEQLEQFCLKNSIKLIFKKKLNVVQLNIINIIISQQLKYKERTYISKTYEVADVIICGACVNDLKINFPNYVID